MKLSNVQITVLYLACLGASVAGCSAQAQQIIDTGLRSSTYQIFGEPGAVSNALVSNLPLFDEDLGKITNATLTGTAQFNWPDPIYHIAYMPGPGFLGSESVTFSTDPGAYLTGAKPFTGSFIGDSAICSAASGGTCLGGSFHFSGVTLQQLSISAQGTAVTGTTIPISLSSHYQGQGSFSGEFSISGIAGVDISYQALSIRQYAQEALDNTTGAGGIGRGSSALQYITSLRNSDAGTSSSNLALRDTQAGFYGYNAGSKIIDSLANLQPGSFLAALLLANGQSPNSEGFASPQATVLYNALKLAGETGHCPSCLSFIKSLGNPNLPGSPASTDPIFTNEVGYDFGLLHPHDISGLPAALEGGITGLFSTGSSVSTSANAFSNLDLGSLGKASFYAIQSKAGEEVYIDPINTKSFIFSVAGADISGFELPTTLGSQEITSAYLTVDGKTVQIEGGIFYSLFNLFGTDPDVLALSGLSGPLVPDRLTFGFSFDKTANLELLNLQVSAVPEPSTWAMMLLGFGGLGALAYRRKRLSATLPDLATA